MSLRYKGSSTHGKEFDHKITQIYTRNLFLERKALPTTFLSLVKTLTKNILFFSFSTGFLFSKKKKCCVNLVESRGLLIAIYFRNDYSQTTRLSILLWISGSKAAISEIFCVFSTPSLSFFPFASVRIPPASFKIKIAPAMS